MGFSPLRFRVQSDEEYITGTKCVPVFHSHEGPSWVPSSGIVTIPPSAEDASDTIRADELNLDVTPTRMRDPDFDSDVLEFLEVVVIELRLGDGHRARHAPRDDRRSTGSLLEHVHRSIVYLDSGHLDECLRLHKLPLASSFDEFVAVNHAVAILVAEEIARCRLLPIRVLWIDLQ